MGSLPKEQLLALEQGADGIELDVTLTADGAVVTIGANGNYTYNPNGSTAFETLAFGSTLTDSFTYTVTNSHAQSTVGTVNVAVTLRCM